MSTKRGYSIHGSYGYWIVLLGVYLPVLDSLPLLGSQNWDSLIVFYLFNIVYRKYRVFLPCLYLFDPLTISICIPDLDPKWIIYLHMLHASKTG